MLVPFPSCPTQDAMHVGPAVALANKGYDILLEKPMAVTAEDCVAIVDAVRRNGVKLAVCHVLRYTPYQHRIMDLLAAVGARMCACVRVCVCMCVCVCLDHDVHVCGARLMLNVGTCVCRTRVFLDIWGVPSVERGSLTTVFDCSTP